MTLYYIAVDPVLPVRVWACPACGRIVTAPKSEDFYWLPSTLCGPHENNGRMITYQMIELGPLKTTEEAAP